MAVRAAMPRSERFLESCTPTTRKRRETQEHIECTVSFSQPPQLASTWKRIYESNGPCCGSLTEASIGDEWEDENHPS